MSPEDITSIGRISETPITTTTTNQLENIKVAVRLRPFTERERTRNNKRIVDIEKNTIVLYSPRYGDTSLKKFTFDYSYWSHDGFKRDSDGVNRSDTSHPNSEKYVGQEKVFEDLGKFLLKNALEGYNSALLAYGQTGSGKSYTVSGYGQNEGILPRFARALFEELELKSASYSCTPTEENGTNSSPLSSDQVRKESDSGSNNRYEVYFSMIEIYNEVVRDLLAKNHVDMIAQSTISRRGLKVREHPKHGFFVESLTSYACASKDEIERKIEEGHLNKSIAATSMNETSSRGHTIYEFRIKQYKLKSGEGSEEILTTSVVQLVDLAGSERMAVHLTNQTGDSRSNTPYPRNEKTTSKRVGPKVPSSASSASSSAQQSNLSMKRGGHNMSLHNNIQQRFKENISINQSLSALGNCIQVLSQYSQQMESSNQTKRPPPKIPYRDSVLTKLLNKCCLSGNSKVVIIATLSPADMNYDDTLSTLRFADRAKQIQTHAKINRMSRGEMVDTLQRENERLKQMVDGRVTRSDDSSQTSNFDDNENIIENFTGSQIGDGARELDTVATPIRSRTSIRKSRDERQSSKKISRGSPSTWASSSSNPSLAVKENMKRLVSPASRKLAGNSDIETKEIHKSQSVGQGLSEKSPLGGEKTQNSDVIYDLDDGDALDEIGLNELGDIQEGLISPESDESFAALADEDLSNDEKIEIFNRLLSNSSVSSRLQESSEGDSKKKLQRPKRSHKIRAGIKQVSMLSSSLKKSNPFISNLNPDEQLTGMISYIIKHGETIVGKDNDCDVVLHGPELRGKHAKIIRLVEGDNREHDDSTDETLSSTVYLEPIYPGGRNVKAVEKDIEKNVALMVNGSPVTKRIKLNHCDRILVGTNLYFVFVDNSNTAGSTVADFDLVTYDTARNEVLRRVLAEEKNEAMIKEINDYTHRPGTGKHRTKPKEETKDESKRVEGPRLPVEGPHKLTRTTTIEDGGNEIVKESKLETEDIPPPIAEENVDIKSSMEEVPDVDAAYRDQLMEDTYEFAMPVAEVNAVAREMGIKVSYGLKILTSEEQLPDQMAQSFIDSNTSDGLSSSSTGEIGESNGQKVQSASSSVDNEPITQLSKLDYLDEPPALYIKVHLEELDMDFYWSKEKFQARRYKILEMYGPWDVGGKSGLVEYLIDQSRVQGEYLIDPFIDDPNSSFVLVGHAQVTLQPISHLSDMKQVYDILDLNDQIVGTISIQAIPCHPEKVNDDKHSPYKHFTDDDIAKNLIENPRKLLEKKLVFALKIVSCTGISERYSNLFCQYLLNPDSGNIRTKLLRDDSLDHESIEEAKGELLFNHTHYICCEKVSEDTLDFFEHGFLTIQVVGQYKLPDKTIRCHTMISTIIRSINKYKFKMEQSSYNGMNYSNMAYAASNSNTDSAKSNRGPLSGVMNSNSGASSVGSTSATVNYFDQQNEDDDGMNSMSGVPQENIIDMILTKRKLDRAENQLHYLKRTVNIAEHYNKKHIPVKTVKKLLNSYGQELESGSLEDMAADGEYVLQSLARAQSLTFL